MSGIAKIANKIAGCCEEMLASPIGSDPDFKRIVISLYQTLSKSRDELYRMRLEKLGSFEVLSDPLPDGEKDFSRCCILLMHLVPAELMGDVIPMFLNLKCGETLSASKGPYTVFLTGLYLVDDEGVSEPTFVEMILRKL